MIETRKNLIFNMRDENRGYPLKNILHKILPCNTIASISILICHLINLKTLHMYLTFFLSATEFIGIIMWILGIFILHWDSKAKNHNPSS